LALLVLLPGLDGTGDLFAPFVAALKGVEAHVVRYPDRAMDYAAHEEYARRALPEDQDYVLLAESFSGPIGINIAASRPSRMRGLVLCATFASNPLPLFGPLSRLVANLPAARVPPALAAPWLYAGRSTAELRRAHAVAISRVSPRTLNARVAALLAVDRRAELRRIDVPVLYMRAMKDRLVGRQCWESIRAACPEAELAEFDAPHFLLQTEPQACAARVTEFVERVSG
jgi:pimeloyl-ACP methyl ester carboxylesterase